MESNDHNDRNDDLDYNDDDEYAESLAGLNMAQERLLQLVDNRWRVHRND